MELSGKVSANELVHCNLVAPSSGNFRQQWLLLCMLYNWFANMFRISRVWHRTVVYWLSFSLPPQLRRAALHPPQLRLGLRSEIHRRKLDLQKQRKCHLVMLVIRKDGLNVGRDTLSNNWITNIRISAVWSIVSCSSIDSLLIPQVASEPQLDISGILTTKRCNNAGSGIVNSKTNYSAPCIFCTLLLVFCWAR